MLTKESQFIINDILNLITSLIKGNSLEGVSVKNSFQILFFLNDKIKREEILVDIIIYSRAVSIALVPFTKIERLSRINRYGTTSLLTNYRLKYTNKKFAKSTSNVYSPISVDDCAKRMYYPIIFINFFAR